VQQLVNGDTLKVVWADGVLVDGEPVGARAPGGPGNSKT
jgi:hypothetical protein